MKRRFGKVSVAEGNEECTWYRLWKDKRPFLNTRSHHFSLLFLLYFDSINDLVLLSSCWRTTPDEVSMGKSQHTTGHLLQELSWWASYRE
jgi:hypothetical protein